MDELEDKITREIQILNDERQYMKQLAEDVEIGKFGSRVSAPPTSGSQPSVQQTDDSKPKFDTVKIAPLNYDNAILVINLMILILTIQLLFSNQYQMH